MAALEDRLGNDCEATVRLRRAAEVGDVEAVLDTLSADAAMHSPVTDRITFSGREDLAHVLGAVFSAVQDIHYIADIGDQRTRALFYTARVGGQHLEEAMRVELNERGEICEATIFYRPLPGLATFAAAVAPRVARGRLRALVARVLLAPLGLATRLGERLVPLLT